MILGVSHIVLGTASLEADSARFQALGYDVGFIETNLPTHPGKRPFMESASERQGIAFCPAPVGPAIELIGYGGELAPCAAPLQIVLASSVPDDAAPVAIDDAIARAWKESLGPLPCAASVPGISGALWFGNTECAGTMVHFVRDLAATRSFWMKLGWAPPKRRAVTSGSDWALLDFSSAVARWRASLLLVQTPLAVSEHRLDTAGFRCLSLVTSDLATDSQLLTRAGAEASTGRMEYTINQKPLALEIFAGPDGVMIELLEVQRGPR